MKDNDTEICGIKALVEVGYLVSGCIVMAAVPPAEAGPTVELLEHHEAFRHPTHQFVSYRITPSVSVMLHAGFIFIILEYRSWKQPFVFF